MKTKLSIKLIALIIIVVIFGGIALSTALDLWSTGGSGSNRGSNKENIGSGSGSVNGNTTFQQLYDMGITENELEKILEREPPSTNMKVREFCQDNGIEFSSVKNELQAIIDSAS